MGTWAGTYHMQANHSVCSFKAHLGREGFISLVYKLTEKENFSFKLFPSKLLLAVGSLSYRDISRLLSKWIEARERVIQCLFFSLGIAMAAQSQLGK